MNSRPDVPKCAKLYRVSDPSTVILNGSPKVMVERLLACRGVPFSSSPTKTALWNFASS